MTRKEVRVDGQNIMRDIFSPKGLLGTISPIQFLINLIIQSTNHMAVSSMHLGVVKTIS